MEKVSGEHSSEHGQQSSAQPTRPRPTAEQLAEFAASHSQTKQKREAPEPFTKGEEAPARRTQAPQSTGVHNQLFLGSDPVNQSYPVLPPITASNQGSPAPDASPKDHEIIPPVTSALGNNADLREQLREEIRKEMEQLYESRLAKSTSDVDALWRKKRDERTKEVESYWKQKLAELGSSGREDKTRELHEEIEKLKKRLERGPGLIKAAEERGKRQGELDGYNKLSLNPELKPSQDRLNFDFLMKEKNKEIADVKTARDNWFRDARKYSVETESKLRKQDQEIQRLQAQVQNPLQQQPLATDNTDALIAAGQEMQARFENQKQALVSLQQRCIQQDNDLANLKARLDNTSQESSARDQQLGARSAELGELSEELSKKTKEVSILRRESDQKSVELNDSNEELKRKSVEINILREEHQQQSKELDENRRQVEAQSREIASLKTLHDDSESSKKEKDRKIASLRELLDSSSHHQSNSSDQEEIKLLKDQLAESQALLNDARSENGSVRDHQARHELEYLQATSETENAAPTEAETQLVQAMLEKEREKIEAQNSRRENRVNETLERLEETERERRQILKAELDGREAELYGAQKRIIELEQQLLASSSQSSQSPSQAPKISQHPLPPAPLPPAPPAAVSIPSPRRSRFLGPRSLLIVILIFLLTFFAPFLHSLANTGSDHELGGLASREDRLQWEAWELSEWERDEGVPTYEESWRRTQEVGQMGHWGFNPV